MSTIIQRAFAAGELSPSLRQRVDISKYQTGLSTCRNFQIMRYGGASNRAGTQFIGEVKNSLSPVRLIPFVFNANQTYVLEFGNLYMRVIKNGSYVFSSGVVYEIATPYLIADIPLIEYVQSADVITLVHQNYPPKKLSRTGDASWTLVDYQFAPSQLAPALFQGSVTTAGAVINKYRATNVNKATGEESLLSVYSPGAYGASYGNRIKSITQANPPVVTTADKFGGTAAHGFLTGDTVTFDKMLTGMVELSNQTVTITKINDTQFSIQNIDATSYSPFVFDSNRYFVTRYYDRLDSAALTTSAPNTLVYYSATSGFSGGVDTVFTAKTVNIYKESNGVYGYLGSADYDTSGKAVFRDVGLTPNVTDQAPTANNPFDQSGNYPGAVSYIQQRLAFANTINDPEKVWLSRTGQFTNFTTDTPIADDNSISFRMVGRQVNEVRYLVDVGNFVVLTSGGEWQAIGDNGVITPTSISLKQASYNGSAPGLQPIIIDNTCLYTQARGTIIRDLAFNFQTDGYTGNDLTIYSTHLFDKFTLKDWAYQQVPQSTLWVVRNDGILLGLTYIKEQQIIAWHRHDTDGVFENVTTVPEGNEDALYCVVRRTINGVVKRYVERFNSRKVLDIRDSRFLDCCLTYDGRNRDLTKTMTVSSISGQWTYEDPLNLTASYSAFSSTDIQSQIQLTDLNGNVIRLTIVSYTSSTQVVVMSDRTVPLNFQGTAFTTWAKAVKSLSGLSHLEGKSVSVFADAGVVASPNNPNYDPITVTGGKVTLDKPYSVIHVGLPYVSDLETLAVDSTQSETLFDKQKLITEVSIAVEETRGGFMGVKAPSGLNPIENLTEVKPRLNEPYDQPDRLMTSRVKMPVAGDWNQGGKVFLRQVDPLPMAILAIAPSGLMPFRQG